jgi:hypothetical protein
MRRDELEKVVEREMPGHRLARRSRAESAGEADAPAPPDAATPSLEALRKKYLRGKYLAPDAAADEDVREEPAARSSAVSAPAGADDEDVIVAVEPEAPTHPWDRGSRPKAVVVSAKDKKIVGKQG